LLYELIEGSSQTIEPGAQACRLTPNANPEMLRHFKE
jgi:hypothetical protein